MNKKYKQISILLIAVLCMILTACGAGENADKPKIYTGFDTRYEGKMQTLALSDSDQNYYDTGIIKDSCFWQDTTVQLAAGEVCDPFFYIKNGLGNQKNFTIVVLDNYKQIEIEVDGERMKNCTVSLEDEQEIFIPVKIEGLPEGEHKLDFLLFIDAYSKNQQENNSGFIDGISETIVEIGDKTGENHTEKSEDGLETISDFEQSETNSDGIFLEQNGDGYNIRTGNLDEEKQERLIMLFDNYEQVSLGEEMLYLRVELNPASAVRIPAGDKINELVKDGKRHEFVAVGIQPGRQISGSDDAMFSNTVVIEK